MPQTEQDGCPYGLSSCPKIADLEKRIRKIEMQQHTILSLLGYLALIISIRYGLILLGDRCQR